MSRLTSCFLALMFSSVAFAEPWSRHTIDASLNGADGVRLADFNGDGLQDVVSGWEESGIVRLYLNPGPDAVTKPWPAVTVGKAKSPEDAVPFDIDGDGNLDVVSCHEGSRKQILVHRFAGQKTINGDLLNKNSWKTSAFSQVDGQQWMFAVPIQLRSGMALIAGAKGKNASITLLPQPAQDRSSLKRWKPNRLRDAGWIMSMYAIDMDADGDEDLVFSDRKGPKRGVAWLEQPNENAATDSWIEHKVGASEGEPLFIDVSPERILVSSRNSTWTDLRRSPSGVWNGKVQPNPKDIPHGKAIKRLGQDSLVMTSNTDSDKLKTKRPGIWLKQADKAWQSIGTATNVKFDRIECLDLDGDGDLDVMTCEERRNLGVVWYENPN